MNSKVLVVGTTTDYIEWIRQARPNQALFITDNATRDNGVETPPHPSEELLADLDDYSGVESSLRAHLEKWNTTISGITCFDCESLELAAILAGDFLLPFPSVESIKLCRDKYTCKIQWHKNSVPCPQVRLVQSYEDILSFLQEINAPSVIKPLTGSGSELVFHCTSKRDCHKWVTVLQEELQKRQSHRLYSKKASWFLAEEYIDGDEYSCDFIIKGKQVEIIRLTRKIHADKGPFGTISGYALADYSLVGYFVESLKEILYRGAKSLGIRDAICMVDFIVQDKSIMLLEMTPRPGGDCIPHLLYRSGITDILSLALDFAQQKPLSFRSEINNGQYVGLRFHARQSGKIVRFDTELLRRDERIREINLIRETGHQVTLPPEDYDSWYLGYAIFQPSSGIDLEIQCRDLSRNLIVEMG